MDDNVKAGKEWNEMKNFSKEIHVVCKRSMYMQYSNYSYYQQQMALFHGITYTYTLAQFS